MPIKKYSAKDKNYTLSYASLVELNPHDINDVKALDEIAFNFGNDSYVDNIALISKEHINVTTKQASLFLQLY